MAESEDTTQDLQGQSGHAHSEQLDQGTYDIIRNRLRDRGKTLRTQLDKLNEERKEVFGSIEFELTGTDRITTDHNCVPRDMTAVGDRILVGYNVQFGLKTEINLSDVFAVYRFVEGKFEPEPLDLIDDSAFRKDFQDLYRFYKKTVFAKLFRKGPHLYMKFRVGQDVNDFKAFKWAVATDDAGNTTLKYIDNRSDHEVRYPTQHDFTWTRAGRDEQRPGKHPHVSINDQVFIETTGGDLTIKVEDNTETGQGIYSEPVDDPDQTLDDAEYEFVSEGHLILLRIRPYQEHTYRYFIFNTKLQEVHRCDTIGHACVLLPDDHGLMFCDGYYLASGELQTFPTVPANMVFERRIPAPNGEDYLYIFYNRDSGAYALMAYNLIAQTVETPTVCNGYAFFADGTMVYFKAGEEPQKHHAVQVWQTPIVGPNYEPPTQSDSYLYKIGNRDIVRGMAECVEVLGLIHRDDPYAELYLDIVRTAEGLLDSYFWLDDAASHGLAETIRAIRDAAQAAVGEFEKVTRVRKQTAKQTNDVAQEAEDLVNRNATKIYDSINVYVESLGGLRSVRGKVIALKELRYADLPRIDELEQRVTEQTDALSQRTAEFLLKDEALVPYVEAATEHESRIEQVAKVTEAKALEEDILKTAGELEMLIDIVGNLKIDDATQRTAIIDSISAVFAELNASRTKLKNRIQQLGRTEGVAEFNSQLKLLNQSVVNYLDLSDTPEKTEQYLTKVMVQVEELEGRFAEFDEFVLQLTEKRDEVYNAFENRKLQLIEKRNKRANALAQAADRILGGVQSRVEQMTDINDIHGYFAADLMIDKVRDIVDELVELDDTVRVDDIQSRMKTIREDAVRQLKDRQELQEGGNVIRFGRHKFSINTQDIDLTTVLRDDVMQLHLAGTRFFEPIDDPAFNATRPVWSQEVVSENDGVYRAEYLAYLIYNESLSARTAATIKQIEAAQDAVKPQEGTADVSAEAAESPETGRATIPSLPELAALDDAGLLAVVQRFMAPRYSEGYTKGVHDADAAKILRVLADIGSVIDLLRFPSDARALASLYWHGVLADGDHPSHESARRLAAQLAGFGQVHALFPDASKQKLYAARAAGLLRAFAEQYDALDPALADEAGAYLCQQLMRGERFVIGPEAAALATAFREHLKQNRATRKFNLSIEKLAGEDNETLAGTRVDQFALIRDWLDAFADSADAPAGLGDLRPCLDEAAAVLLDPDHETERTAAVTIRLEIAGLIGSHPVLRDGTLDLHFNRFLARLGRFASVDVPRFTQYTEMKRRFVDNAREEMRLEEFEPKVLTSFVRNKLIDSVFLPLIGDNLAKQIGTTGENKRTDRMGLLLLISPPGYGKTTLMEYIANRLGIVFMKINGPAIGHGVTSLDPEEAPNASAREEVEKLNLALEMGDNVLLYLDDIQHTHPELLQKFISLCDAQRRIEGVYKGKTRTYDLRGRKFAVVMAGNPYTESGDKFQIPDMLANRADTYNLGDIIGEHGDAFKMSYLENCLTSNPTLNTLAARSQKDVYAIIQIAETGSREGVDFEGSYSAQEVEEMATVMRKLITVRDVILKVNLQYIASAGQEDAYRTEPPFQLQGSYRNMNRIAEKIVPVMNDEELMGLIVATYEQDAQTLTTGAEANLLKFRQMIGIITPEELERWEAIKASFVKNNAVAAMGGDTAAAVVSQLAGFNQGLGAMRESIGGAIGQLAEAQRAAQQSNAAKTKAEPDADLAKQLGPVLAQVGSLGDRLDAIRDALDHGAAELAKAAKPAKTKPASKKKETPATVEAKLDPDTLNAIHALVDQLGNLPAAANALHTSQPKPAPEHSEGPDSATQAPAPRLHAPPDPDLPHEIRVVNKIPSTFLYVMKEQFALMKGWLEPLTRITADQDDQLKSLHTKVETILERYDTMIDRLEKNKPEGGSEAEVVDDD
ncbi:MAG: DNA repair ATPase [Phycisphaerales bacterium JB063]